MLSRFFLNNLNTKMLAPHAVDIAVTILTLIASLCFTFADYHSTTFFSSSSQVVHWSAEIQTKVYDPRIDQPTKRPSEWIRARSLNSYFAFCKIVVKRKVPLITRSVPLYILSHDLVTHKRRTLLLPEMNRSQMKFVSLSILRSFEGLQVWKKVSYLKYLFLYTLQTTID